MKNTLFSILTAGAVSLPLSAETGTLAVSVTQSADRTVCVTYDLDEDAIVTVGFSANGKAVPEDVLADSVSGDVNRYVAKGEGRQILWTPDFRRFGADASPLAVTVKAWSPSTPPDYMVTKIGGGKDDIRFYASADSLPEGGLANRIYATDYIVWRKIPAAGVQWRMGAVKSGYEALGLTYPGMNSQNRERPHYVTFTKDYYMAVYPLTQRQGGYYLNSTNCTPKNPDSTGINSYSHPWNGYSYNEIRGSVKGALWPALTEDETYAHQVDEGSLVYNMRTGIGIPTIDLPTYAQYEFACRAGTGSNFYNGQDAVTADMTTPGTLYAYSNGLADEPQPVGLLQPNPWGLYDMQGNVYSWVLDFDWPSNKSGDPETDPRGYVGLGQNRIWVGNLYNAPVAGLRSSFATAIGPDNKGVQSGIGRVGARIVCDADMTGLAAVSDTE